MAGKANGNNSSRWVDVAQKGAPEQTMQFQGKMVDIKKKANIAIQKAE